MISNPNYNIVSLCSLVIWITLFMEYWSIRKYVHDHYPNRHQLPCGIPFTVKFRLGISCGTLWSTTITIVVVNVVVSAVLFAAMADKYIEMISGVIGVPLTAIGARKIALSVQKRRKRRELEKQQERAREEQVQERSEESHTGQNDYWRDVRDWVFFCYFTAFDKMQRDWALPIVERHIEIMGQIVEQIRAGVLEGKKDDFVRSVLWHIDRRRCWSASDTDIRKNAAANAIEEGIKMAEGGNPDGVLQVLWQIEVNMRPADGARLLAQYRLSAAGSVQPVKPTDNVSESEERRRHIRERAYFIWKNEGSPSGRDLDHWCRAEAEVMAAD
jgi:hypothetical protein